MERGETGGLSVYELSLLLPVQGAALGTSCRRGQRRGQPRVKNSRIEGE